MSNIPREQTALEQSQDQSANYQACIALNYDGQGKQVEVKTAKTSRGGKKLKTLILSDKNI